MFPQSPHPDTVLCAIKDNYYIDQIAQYFEESLRDVVGARRTEILKPEVLLAARGLYFSLTIGAGKQTLGQEYCDISLVGLGDGGQIIPLQGVRQACYTLLEVVAPYLWHRGVTGPGWSELRELRGRRHRLNHHRRWVMGTEESELSTSPTQHVHSQRTLLGPMYLRSLTQFCLKSLKKLMQRKIKILLWLSRLHLALFFLNARYYTWAMRLCRVKLLRICQLDRPRPSYAIMGIFLFIQVVVEALQATKQSLAGMLGTTREEEIEHRIIQETLNAKVPSQSIEDLDPQSKHVVGSGERCILCMSPRVCTSATPCGHLFCWECILGWVATNPECPICRQPTEPQSIVVVRHYKNSVS